MPVIISPLVYLLMTPELHNVSPSHLSVEEKVINYTERTRLASIDLQRGYEKSWRYQQFYSVHNVKVEGLTIRVLDITEVF